MKKLLTLALALVALAIMRTEVMAQPPPTINLNTGYDQWINAKIDVSQQDNEWRVIQSPPNNPPQPPPATGRPADVVNDNVWVQCNPNLPTHFPNSRWISFAPNAGLGTSIVASYIYRFYFTLPPGFSSPQLTMKLSADDIITSVKLNSHELPTGSGGIFCNNPPLSISSSLPAWFLPGPSVNELTVTVKNTVAGTITGLIVDGTVTYTDCKRGRIRGIPGLTSITFWESTGVPPTSHQFQMTDQALIERRSGTLSSLNKDFEGTDAEFYDVFISDWNGTHNDATGQFVTIEAVVNIGAPSGGGLNIARVDFNGTNQFADSVASFVALGNNAMPNDVGKAVDGLLTKDTTMGNTIDQKQRLRVTVGFPCNPSPPVCDRQIQKTVTPNPVQSGQLVTTTLIVTNVGTAPCAVVGGINVGDGQPSGLIFQLPVSANKPGWSCGFSGPGVIAFCTSTSPLLPGAANAVTITFTAKVTAPAGSTILNCAEVTNVGDANQANNKSCVTVNVKKKIGPPADPNRRPSGR